MNEPNTDRATARSYAEALFGSTSRGALIEVRFRAPSGMSRCFQSVSRLDRLADTIVTLAEHTEVFVGVLPRWRRGGSRADVIARGRVLWADCDCAEAVAALRAFRPPPAMVVASSEQNRHAYWLLTEPFGVDVIEQTNRRIALALGADARCSDRARILRPAGSVNRKRPETVPVRLVDLAPETRVSLAELDRVLPCEPPRAGSPPRRRIMSSDTLEEIPPPVYFERLTGLRVGPSGKLRCLFHDDRSPSLHVYREPGRGWYCFGCGRGGSIFDLAALLSGRDTRGQDFAELRRELEELMFPARERRACETESGPRTASPTSTAIEYDQT
jgi:hypothetical protein